MNWATVFLFQTVLWTTVGFALVFRRELAEAIDFALNDSPKYDMLGYVAFALGAWNLARWFGIRAVRKNREIESQAAEEREERLRELDGQKPVVNPEFDFTRRDDTRNGDGH